LRSVLLDLPPIISATACYGTGDDENWGKPLGIVTFGSTVLHDLRSVTKSIVGMLYGIALADGQVPPPEARLYDQFPEYAELARLDASASLSPTCSA